MQHDIGRKIKSIRRAAKLTQKQLGLALGVAEITVRQYENGQRQPKIETLQRIATALGVDISELLSLDQRSEFVQRHVKEYIEENPDATVIESGEVLGFRTLGDKAKAMRQEHMDTYDRLNPEGQVKVQRYTKDIAEMPKYTTMPTLEETQKRLNKRFQAKHNKPTEEAPTPDEESAIESGIEGE